MPGQSLAAESSTPIQDTPSEAKSNRQPLYLAGGSSTAPVTITPEKLSKHVHLRVQIRTPSPVPPGSSSTIESPVAHPVHASPSGSPIVLNTPTGGAAVQASGAASPSMSAAPSAAPFSLANTGPVEKAPSPAAASTSTIATATVPATAIATAIISPQPLLKQRVSFAVVDESPRKAKPANEAWSPTAAEQKSSKQPAETKQQAIEMEIKAVTIREVESTDDTALSSSTDSLDSPSTRSCFCFRLKRIPPRVLQFPSQRGGGDATRQQKDKKGQAYAAPEDIASDSLNSSSTENHPYSFVYESNACWQGVIRVWHALVGFYCAVQLPLLALLHIVDTGLDVAVALWWGGFVGDSGENSALAGRADSMRWAIAAAVCISLPILISVILDALKPAQRPPSSSSAANSQIQPPNKWLLVLMNMLQLRGCYEVILIRRMNAAAAASDALTNPTATPAQQRELQQERDTQESQETHSQQITRCIFQCAPMMLLQLGVLASMYDSTSSPYDGAGGPPNLPWSSILLLSFFSSFLCLLTTIHRLLGSSPAFRKRAGKTGLVWFAGGMIAMHVAPTALGFILLLHILPWWVTLAAAGGSNLITGLLMLRAELCSPTRSRNENASHVIGILRLLFVLAPVETLTAAISASDLVSAANSAASGGRGGSSKRGWGHFRNEYWPLLVWQSLACIGCTVAYGCLGSLWTVELVGLMAGCIVGRILAVTFLVPKVDY